MRFSAAAEYDAELTLLHVLEKVPSTAKTEEAIAEATEQLNKLIPPERRNTPKIKTAVCIGKPYQKIVQFAQEQQIELLTMGVRGRGALDLAVFGSTTYRSCSGALPCSYRPSVIRVLRSGFL
jgi:nucleotide-binding universal stress UspA family protein